MDLENRIRILADLGKYMQSDDDAWKAAKIKTSRHNAWFIPDFVDLSVKQIAHQFLRRDLLEKWLSEYDFPVRAEAPKRVGIVMAGNIPLVGFHDFISCYLSGHQPIIKLSSKDPWLFPLLADFVNKHNPATDEHVQMASMLRSMDAYIATGSNNSARYFDYYFGRYPSLIRRNRTSIALLAGDETPDELDRLADDVFLYFGLGCRNVTQIHVPENYDFIPLLRAFRKYQWMADHNKYRNNYDYQLSLAILNKQYFMTNDCLLLQENSSPFSPISVLHYAFYNNPTGFPGRGETENLQCIYGRNFIPFGKSQQPGLRDYADGLDTLRFLRSL